MSRPSDQELLTTAREALRFAYAPYSGFRVGAALLTEGGRIYTGCNIENASYGLTVCAERVALFCAVAQGELRFRVLAVANDSLQPAYPCGACRQVLSEFADNLEIIVCGSEGEPVKAMLAELLPHAFRSRRNPRQSGRE